MVGPDLCPAVNASLDRHVWCFVNVIRVGLSWF